MRPQRSAGSAMILGLTVLLASARALAAPEPSLFAPTVYPHIVNLSTVTNSRGNGTLFTGSVLWIGIPGSGPCFPGYENNVSQVAFKRFTIPSGSSWDLSYRYRVDSQIDSDETKVILDVSGQCPQLQPSGVYAFTSSPSQRVTLASFTGSAEGDDLLDLSDFAGRTVCIVVHSTSDAAGSDADCGYDSRDGLFEIDQLQVGPETTTFDTGPNGWTFGALGPLEPSDCAILVLPKDGSTSTNERAPNSNFRFGRAVYLITASEMAASGLANGATLAAVGWRHSTAGIAASGTLAVYMQNTSSPTNTKNTDWATAIGTMTLVHNAATTIPSTTTGFDIPFSGGSPFTYTGGGLYIAFDWQWPGPAGSGAVVACNTDLVNGLLGANGTAAPPTTIAPSNFRPETRLTPAPSLLVVDVTPDGATTVCTGGSITYTAGTSGGIGPFTYQWTENGIDIAGATGSTLAATKGSPGSFTYNVEVIDHGGCAAGVDPSPSTGTWVGNGSSCDDGNVCTLGDVCSGGVCTGGPPPTPVRFCSTGSIVIHDATPPTAASPYPSTIAVSGLGTYLCSVSLELDGLSHTFPDDIDMLLSGPGPQNNIVMSDVGGGHPVSGMVLRLNDAASMLLPDQDALSPGTFKPTDVDPGTGTEIWPAPAPAPLGGSPFSVYVGTNPNGIWRLYVVDDEAGDSGSLDGWCIELSTVCLHDSECDDQNLCTTDVCDPQTSSCSHPPVGCDDADSCTLDSCAPQTGCVHVDQCNEYCANVSITIYDSDAAGPYPGTLTIAAPTGSCTLARVKLNGLTHSFISDVDMLLEGPGSQNAMILSDVGGASAVAAVSLVLTDSAPAGLPPTAFPSGTYRPTDFDPGDILPAPAPAPAGGAALSVFDGTDPNGTWRLWIVDDAAADTGSLTNWCLDFLCTDTPGIVTGVVWEADGVTLTWDALASRYDVLRGRLNELPVGAGPNEICFDDVVGSSLVEGAIPAPPFSGFWYLVRGDDPGAPTPGSYGDQSNGQPRVSTACP